MRRLWVWATLCALSAPTPAFAFYETETVDLRGTFLLNETFLRLADAFGGPGSQTGASFRLLAAYTPHEIVSLESHLLLGGVNGTQAGLLVSADADRLTRNIYRRPRIVVDGLIDRLFLQLDFQKVNVKLGRQPVNLTTSYYFTPNDFFVPFAAQTFFRLYKPGVDAARVDIQLGELSELTILGVLGGNQAFEDASALARLSFVVGDFELSALGGRRPDAFVVGGAFQGELFEWLGVRGEGHVRIPTVDGPSATVEATVNLERRFENTLSLRLESFYHGAGATSVDAYQLFGAGQYAARGYTALGAGYELTPLLNAEALAIVNWVDGSVLLALYGVYSLDDEMELGVSMNAPVGRGPTDGPTPRLRSELGSFPWLFDAQFRAYF